MNLVFNEPVSIGRFFDRFDDGEKEKRELIQSMGSREILSALDEVGRAWKGGRYREKATEILRETSGLSEATIAEGLDMLPEILSGSVLEKRIVAELGGDFLDGWGRGPVDGVELFAAPLGSLLHVLAGNAFVSGVESLVNGIVTKNLNVVKVSSSDRSFPYLFLESIADCSSELASTISMLYFRGGSGSVERRLKERMDGIIVWGGEDAVMSYKKDLPVGKTLIEHGPKCGIGIVEDYEEGLAERIARDIVSWEQRSCASLQVLYIKNGMESLMGEIGTELDRYPKNPLDSDQAVEVRKAREIARMGRVFEDYDYLFSEEPLKWQIIVTSRFELSPLGRTLYIRKYEDVDEIIREVPKAYMQTVAISGSPETGRRLALAGATRIVEFGRMLSGVPGAPHDGDFPLRELVRFCGREV